MRKSRAAVERIVVERERRGRMLVGWFLVGANIFYTPLERDEEGEMEGGVEFELCCIFIFIFEYFHFTFTAVFLNIFFLFFF